MQSRLLGRTALLVVLWLLTSSFGEAAPQEKLSLDQLLQEVLIHHPKLRAAQARLDEAQAMIRESHLWSNPEVETEFTRGDGNHLILHLSRSLTPGGKPRRNAAQLELEKARVELEGIKRELTAEVKSAFLSILYRQEQMALAEQESQLARQETHIAQVRFEVGDLSETKLNGALLQLQVAEGNREAIAKLLDSARTSLNSILGRVPETEFTAEGKLEIPEPGQTPESLIQSVSAHPSVRERELERQQAVEALALAKAERLPSPTLSFIYERDVQENLFGGSLGWPLPLFDRKQGALMHAAAHEKRVAADIQAETLDMTQQIWEAWLMLQAASKTVERARAEISLGEANLKAVHRSYELGETGWESVLQAQKALLELEKASLEALLKANRASVVLGRYAD